MRNLLQSLSPPHAGSARTIECWNMQDFTSGMLGRSAAFDSIVDYEDKLVIPTNGWRS